MDQHFGIRHLFYLGLLFAFALAPRLYSVEHLGWSWDSEGSFTLVNFDEGGSCRAALEGFAYSAFIGRQTIALDTMLGGGPAPGIKGDPRAVKAYCHSPQHIRVARNYSAVTGALTAVTIAVIALLLVPERSAVAWTAGALIALSGFHMSESHSGTVDAPSVFFIYLFLAWMVYSLSREKVWGLLASPLLLVPAIWTKYWIFALFSYVAVIPLRSWHYLCHGLSGRRIALLVLATVVLLGLLTNRDFQQAGWYPLLVLWYLLIPWRAVHRPMALVWLLLPLLAWFLCSVEPISTYTTGASGSSYAAIGWHKWLRNLVNLPLVLVLGLGLPACLFIPAGVRAVMKNPGTTRPWLCLSPVLVFAVYMAILAPVTYYRHYLALLPAAALLAALGLYSTRWAGKRWFMVLFLLWPALLAVDLVEDYHRDPRIELRQWYAEHPDARVFFSYYVNPPAGDNRLFQPEYAAGDASALRQATHLILSENWYDTAFANELNGPLTHDSSRLIKTTPEYVRFYRDALAGRHPHLAREQSIEVENFMPELLLHKRLYGTFQIFVGDLVIFRVLN